MNWWHHNWLAMTIIAGLIAFAYYTFQMVALFGPYLLQWMGVVR